MQIIVAAETFNHPIGVHLTHKVMDIYRSAASFGAILRRESLKVVLDGGPTALKIAAWYAGGL